jgi:hypothetical protein
MATRRAPKALYRSESEFSFVPEALALKSGNLIQRYHAKYGYSCLADMLWHSDARDFIEKHTELRQVFNDASRTRSAQRANNSLQALAALIVALEVLARDFAGWGTRFPDAQQKAKKLLDASAVTPRMWLMNEYVYGKSGINHEYARALTR